MWVDISLFMLILVTGCVLLKFTRNFICLFDPTMVGIILVDKDDHLIDKILYWLFIVRIFTFEKQIDFIKLFKKCYKLKNKEQKDKKRYVLYSLYT